MHTGHQLAATLIGWFCTTLGRLAPGAGDRDRGDVPGWVLITLMTAGLVTVLWKLAGTQLADLFSTAITSVSG